VDPLSDVLSLIKIRHYLSGAFDTGGDWSVEFPRFEGVRFYAVVRGDCWLSVDGVSEPIHVGMGDCLLFPNGRSFQVASNLAIPPLDAFTVFGGMREGGITTYNGGGATFGVCALFTIDGNHPGVLLELLPPVLHIREASVGAKLRWPLEQMWQELRDPEPGGSLIAQQLATMVLVQSLRLHLAGGVDGCVGWLFAMADQKMSRAITAMHKDPAHRWTLGALAELAGMSRTSFAVKFKVAVGKSPMDYLTQWRMLLAGDRLAHSADSISVIATSLGYESESAFSTAFKRVMGCSPRQHSRRRDSVSPSQNKSRIACEEG
jgi:AraC-like DNA-binding protein